MEADYKEPSFHFLQRYPPEFTEFLLVNKVPLIFFSDDIFEPKSPVRYIRFKPDFPGEEFLVSKLKLHSNSSDAQKRYEKFIYLPNFYSIPEPIKISSLEPYSSANLYGIDLSSASVVLALSPKNDENILDLCCCPGAKLLFIGDLMQNSGVKRSGTLTGVDINSKRLKICESLCKKYGLDWIQLRARDGVTFDEGMLYDKVLVDAECTHDGSIKHLKKYLPEYNVVKENKKVDPKEEKKEEPILSNKEKKRRKKQEELQKNDNIYISDKTKKNEWSMDDFKERVLDPKKIKEINSLQKNLLINAVRLVKPGGTIIYSTCSYIKSQNEDIVMEICEDQKGILEMVEVFPEIIKKELKWKEGFLAKTVRFDPINSKSGGMFIAALRKIG